MRSLKIGDCRVDVLPVVNGLVSEADKVRAAYGNYEAYGASMSIESLEALKRRSEISTEDMDVSELDMVYTEKMSVFGEIQMPSPAFCEIVDLCTADGKNVIALDMNDYDFDTAYMECVRAIEFTSVHHLAKKGFKKTMDQSSPEALAIAWDRHIASVKGFDRLNKRREAYIAKEIVDTAKYRSSLLCVIEVERVDGIFRILEGAVDG